MKKEDIDRINELARKAKTVGLTPEENEERAVLRRAYIDSVVGDLRQQLSEMDSKIDRNEMDRIRWEVLDFANSCRNKKRHTKSEFEHIIDLNEKYEMLLTRTNETNGVFEEDYRYIRDIYRECCEENKFIA